MQCDRCGEEKESLPHSLTIGSTLEVHPDYIIMDLCTECYRDILQGIETDVEELEQGGN